MHSHSDPRRAFRQNASSRFRVGAVAVTLAVALAVLAASGCTRPKEGQTTPANLGMVLTLKATALFTNTFMVPQEVDDTTTLIRMDAGPGPRIAYVYEISGTREELGARAVSTRQSLRANVCAGKSATDLLKEGVTLVFWFQDAAGNTVVKQEVKPDACNL